MTYKQGCLYAAYLGVPCLIYELIARIPPLDTIEGARTLSRILLFPGWQLMDWLTGGLIARNFEYKLLIPLVTILINLLAWGGVVWFIGNLREGSRRAARD